MPKGVDWSKDMALELIKAGFFQLAKKHHPDAGGSHEKMLTLGATKEHLEGMLNGSGWRTSYQAPPHEETARARAERKAKEEKEQERKTGRKEWKEQGSDEIPPGLHKYAFGWWMIANVEVMRESEKAIQFVDQDGNGPWWMPKSQLHKNANQVWEMGDEGDIVFSEWIARQKGWV